jgi:hypothetical protein
MGVSPQEFNQALGRFFSLQPVASNAQGEITVVTVAIDGIRGSGGLWKRRPTRYQLLIDVSSLRGQLPIVWVLDPADSAIGHVNIFPAATCPIVGKAYPYLCWGTFPPQWILIDESQRTLSGLLEYILQHLNHPNFASRAR